ncbi:9824_t:CDS:2 [Funneliformis caledonium]|uniref:9824_t:CDS:1 n=1 Tax=Funneliformis caledonium TaxID=1117310 RepID=A0A9N8YW92_9GLOM|nr:9824_t:CDS:2 [Funneliformis caledonium]
MELSKTSRNISSMEIKKPQSHQNISQWVTLINSQRYLQKLKLEMFYSKYSSMIALAIPSQYHSLKEVELAYCKFYQASLLDELSSCPNLISLIIKDCSFVEKSKIINHFVSLKSLYISKSQLPQEYFLAMLGQPSKLEKITLNLIDFFKYPKIIPFICLNCSQLKVLEIVLVEETFEKLVSILENCQLLEEVSIWEKFDWIGHEFYDYHDSYFGNYMNPNLVIKKISNHLPRNLKKLHFSQLFNFTFEDIQYFIQNAPNTLQDLKFYAIVNDKND